MTSFDQATIANLRAKIVDARRTAVEVIAKGAGIDDFARYRYSVGFIEALDQIDVFIDEITSDLQRG